MVVGGTRQSFAGSGEPWTVNKELGENIDAFEIQCYGRYMRISYTEHVTNDEVL